MSISVKSVTKNEDTGARIVKVKTSSSKCFKTPTRSATSTEHNYKIETINSIISEAGLGQGVPTSFDNDIFQISKSFKMEQLHKLLKRNGSFKSSKKDIVSKKNAYSDKFTIFYPHFNKKMLFDEKQYIGTENLKTIIDLQTAAGLENVSIPESNPNQNLEIFINDLNSLSNRALANGAKEIIPYLDLGMGEHDSELFSNKYNYLIDAGFNVIGTVYRSYSENYPNFRYLEERDDDVLIYCSGVDRFWRGNWITSQIHTPNFNGIDVTALLSLPTPRGEKEKKSIEEIKRFDKNSLGVITLKDHLDLYGEDLNCNCPVCSNKSLPDIKNIYSVNQKGELDPSYLDKICKLHELYASTKEFENERKYIKDDESKAYIESHNYLKAYLSKVKH